MTKHSTGTSGSDMLMISASTQSGSFITTEKRLSNALITLLHIANNGISMQILAKRSCDFQRAKRKLKIRLGNKELETILSFREYKNKLENKLTTTSNLLRKLTTTSLEENPKALKPAAQAQCYSTAKCRSAARARSCHAHEINPGLRKSR